MVQLIQGMLVKTPSLEKLRKLNNKLRKNSRENYLTILRSTMAACRCLDVSHLASLLVQEKWEALYAEADALSGTAYPDASLHFEAHQISSLIKKYPWDPTEIGTDPERTALDSFKKSEHKCRRMNQKFILLRSLRNPEERYFQEMRDFIQYVIGDSPSLESIYNQCDFGPGASVGVNGDATSFGRKCIAPRMTVSPSALTHAFAAWMSNYQLSEGLFPVTLDGGTYCYDRRAAWECLKLRVEHVSNNKVSFVPKTAKTHRAIAVEPILNTFVQKGIDQFLRARLARVGLDLSDQAPNQRFARMGSFEEVEDPFCTIDLSSASDSISIGLVRALVPPEWFRFLDENRSPSYIIDDTPAKRYQKFCSMGNGFCFPLETLIFSAIAKASGSKRPGIDFLVYGDDIVVRRSRFEETCRLLRYCGFTPNMRKTFSSGPFRESCGADWYNGEDVRPFTLDFKLDSLENVFKFLNLSRRNGRSSALMSRAFHQMLDRIPLRFQFWRPFAGNPDSGIDPLDVEIVPPVNIGWSRRLLCYRWIELRTNPVKDVFEVPNWVVNAAALRGHDSESMFTFRRRTRKTMRLIAHGGAGFAA